MYTTENAKNEKINHPKDKIIGKGKTVKNPDKAMLGKGKGLHMFIGILKLTGIYLFGTHENC